MDMPGSHHWAPDEAMSSDTLELSQRPGDERLWGMGVDLLLLTLKLLPVARCT
ncbi:hypothetical protein HaLaN_23361, partial [Haematococcus lacustris]